MDIKEGFSSNKLVVNVKQGEKTDSDECNTSTNCNPKEKISLIGIRRTKNGRYAAVITDRIRHKKVWLGTFDTVEEASQAYFSKKSEFENEKLRLQGKKKSKRIRKLTRIYSSEKSEELVNVKQGTENVNCEIFQTGSTGGSEIDVLISNSSNGGTEQRIDSREIGSVDEACRIAKEGSKVFNLDLMANVCGTKSSDECNTTTRCDPKVKISLIGVRRLKSGRYAAVITDPIKHKKVSLGTFDTVEEASHAYLSKKSEFEKLRQQGNKENKPKKNCDQIQQPKSSSVVASLDTTASESGRAKRIDSQGEEPGSSKATSCLMANAHSTESTSCDPKARRSLKGIRRRKSGRYAVVITDPIKHKEVGLGTFDTVEEASNAYLAKKSEFEKLRQQGNKENKPKKNCDQIQQPKSSSVVASLDTTASESGRAKRIDSQGEEPGSSKATSCLMANAHSTESTSCDPKARRSLKGIRRRKSGRYAVVITDPIKHKEVGLGTFDTVEEASNAYLAKKSEFEKLRQQGNKENKPKKNCDQIQQPKSSSVVASLDTTASESGRAKRIDSQGEEPGSSKATSCLMANAHSTESTSCDPKARRSLKGIRRRKSGRYAVVITDPIKHKEVGLGTFDTVEEASNAYLAKKSEFEKLRQQGNKENKPKKNCDQIQQPKSSSVVASLDTTASESGRAKRIDSQGEEPGSSKATSCLMANAHSTESTSCDPKARRSLKGIRRRKSGRYAVVITDPIKHKEVGLGTFDTVEEASNAYLAKKSEFEKLRQQGNKENKPKKNCDRIQQPESSSVVASLDTTAGESGSAKRIDSHKTTTHLIGAYKSKTTGRYASQFKNPITKKKIWLGTFDTAEEASHAYQSKKLEFQKLVEAKQQQCTNKQRKSEKLVNVKQGHENENCELKSAEIDVPLSNSSVGGTVQSIDSYQSKKFDLQSSKKVELQSNMPIDSSAGEKQEGQEDDEDLWMGKWVQLPGDDKAVMFSLKLGLPIIDNYGYLIGEFSSLDDLSIS